MLVAAYLVSLQKPKGTIKEVPFSLLKTEETLMSTVHGAIFVLDDNIDTDQIFQLSTHP